MCLNFDARAIALYSHSAMQGSGASFLKVRSARAPLHKFKSIFMVLLIALHRLGTSITMGLRDWFLIRQKLPATTRSVCALCAFFVYGIFCIWTFSPFCRWRRTSRIHMPCLILGLCIRQVFTRWNGDIYQPIASWILLRACSYFGIRRRGS